jgi:hypothetical protein
MTMKRVNWDSEQFAKLNIDERIIALAASAAQLAYDNGEGVLPEEPAEVTAGGKFRIPMLIPEGLESGDGRKMKEGALSTRNLPITLLWQPATGEGHNGSYVVGRIDTIEEVEGGLGNAMGVFDTGPYGREAERLVREKMLRGVSADLDMFEATIDADGTELSDEFDPNQIKSEKMTVTKARVMAATLVAKPAFQECTIELVSDDENTLQEDIPMTDGIYEETPPDREAADFALSVLTASAAPTNPPAEWFTNPELDGPTPLTVSDDGRVFGHIATWETDHIGFNYGVRPPRSRSGYAYFRTGLVRTAEGEDVAVGQLTLAGGHAPLDADAHLAVKHYDDTASAVADVTAGEDAHGIWVSGGLRPGTTPEQVRTLRASAPSGDWRPINGALELVAVCQVNVPGFPIARARVASGAVMSLVAAGASTLHRMRNAQHDELATRLERLERQILEQRKRELAARIEPVRQQRLQQLREAAAVAREKLAPEIQRRRELAAQRDELRKKLATELGLDLHPSVEWDEELHPRDEEGQFRKVLLKLSELLDMESNYNAPDADAAKSALQEAADAEERGDMDAAKKAAGDAAQKLESAAEKAESGDGGEVKADLGGKLHEIAAEVGTAVSPDGDADADGPEVDADSGLAPESDVDVDVDAPADEDKPSVIGEVTDEIVEDLTPELGGDMPQAVIDLIETLIDEVGENVDPQTIISRMDNQVRHWLEGKGFQSPEQMAEWIIKMMERPIQPDIGQ